jgi:hypothetical protein
LKDGAASCHQRDGDSVAKLGARREVNRNKPISSWETSQIQKKQCAKWGEEIKRQLLQVQSYDVDKDLLDLDKSSRKLEEVMRKASEVRWGSAMEEDPCLEQEAVVDPRNDDFGLISSMGLSHTSIHNHSWKPIGPRWVWISKASVAQGIGYPASKIDVQRYGHRVRRVKHIGPPSPLLKSFADIVRVDRMARRDQEQRPWKRRSADWMEEGDLLGGDFYQEQDLRQKLQQGFEGEGNRRHTRGGTILVQEVAMIESLGDMLVVIEVQKGINKEGEALVMANLALESRTESIDSLVKNKGGMLKQVGGC